MNIDNNSLIIGGGVLIFIAIILLILFLSGSFVSHLLIDGTKNTLTSGTILKKNDHMKSADGKYTLSIGPNGNLILYNKDSPEWSSRTNGLDCFLQIQPDNNLVLYDKNKKPLWSSNTNNKGIARTAYLTLLNSGNLVIYDSKNTLLWASNPKLDTKLPPKPEQRANISYPYTKMPNERIWVPYAQNVYTCAKAKNLKTDGPAGFCSFNNRNDVIAYCNTDESCLGYVTDNNANNNYIAFNNARLRIADDVNFSSSLYSKYGTADGLNLPPPV